MTRRVNRVYRGSPITAEGQNRLVDGVNTLADGSVALFEQVRTFEERVLVISNVAPGIGFVTCEYAAGASSGLQVYLWPNLYDQLNYTYTDNNNRTHTPSGTDQVLTPPLKLGEHLLCKVLEHPETIGGYWRGWVDLNITARMWAEVPPP